MATSTDKLVVSLEALEALQAKGVVAIRSAQLSRTNRERLLETGFLKEVFKGWYLASRPEEETGESTAFFSSFWAFIAQYLTYRFGSDWSLSPEQSLVLHSGNRTVPTQLLVRAPSGRNRATEFPYGTSILEVRASIAEGEDLTVVDELPLFTIEAALIKISETGFKSHAIDTRAILAAIPDASALLNKLLPGGHTRAAGRLAGAFRNIGNDRIADEIIASMKAAMHDVRESDPYEKVLPVLGAGHQVSPQVSRVRVMWHKMRDEVIGCLPEARPAPADISAYLKEVEATYLTDAYHSLSIEGYQVSRDLIERVRSGDWNPDEDDRDREHKNAMAARGYWQAFQSVKSTIRTVLEGKNPGEAVHDDLSEWYRELFAPSAAVGLVDVAQLAGYRNGPVYIRRSMHVPMSFEAARQCMPVFFDLLKQEEDHAVRIVLGHFIFVYIHPYSDGNGRTARFLMNVMMAAAGLPWTVIRLERRDGYMASLEKASVEGDIAPFAAFVGDILRDESSIPA